MIIHIDRCWRNQGRHIPRTFHCHIGPTQFATLKLLFRMEWNQTGGQLHVAIQLYSKRSHVMGSEDNSMQAGHMAAYLVA